MAQRICAFPAAVVPLFGLRIGGLGSFVLAAGSGPILQPEEARPGPVTTGDLAGDHRQRPPVPSPPFESVFADGHRMSLCMPLADQLGSGPEAGDATARDIAAPLQGLGELGKSP